MEKLPANAGWHWVREGFALFLKQPAELSMLFLSYLFLMLVLGMIPLLGQLLPLLLMPVFSMAFMQACAYVEQGKRVYPNLLLTGFRSPALRTLLGLGGLYLLAAIIAIAVSRLIDGGVFWSVISGQIPLDTKTIQESDMSLTLLLTALITTPAVMALWYAAPLIMWQDMGVWKSIFYSFFTVRKAGKAFFVYSLAWTAIGVILPAIVSIVIALLFNLNKAVMTLIVLLPLSLLMTVVMYCSFYPTYTAMFGKPSTAPNTGV